MLLVRKVLASSPQAVAGTLEIMLARLLRLREEAHENATAVQQLIAGEEIDPDLLDELLEDQEELLPRPLGKERTFNHERPGSFFFCGLEHRRRPEGAIPQRLLEAASQAV